MKNNIFKTLFKKKQREQAPASEDLMPARRKIEKSTLLVYVFSEHAEYEGLCEAINRELNKLTGYPNIHEYWMFDLEKIFPMFTRKNAEPFGANQDAHEPYWWAPGDWGTDNGKSRLSFLGWLIHETIDDKENLGETYMKYMLKSVKPSELNPKPFTRKMLLECLLQDVDKFDCIRHGIIYEYNRACGKALDCDLQCVDTERLLPLFTYENALNFGADEQLKESPWWWEPKRWENTDGKGRVAFVLWLIEQYTGDTYDIRKGQKYFFCKGTLNRKLYIHK